MGTVNVRQPDGTIKQVTIPDSSTIGATTPPATTTTTPGTTTPPPTTATPTAPTAALTPEQSAQAAYDRAIARLNTQKSDSMRDFGFTESGEFDQNAPNFSATKTMGTDYAQGVDQLEDNATERGLNSHEGLGGQKAALARYLYQNNYDKTRTSFSDMLRDIGTAKTDAKAGLDQNLAEIREAKEAQARAEQAARESAARDRYNNSRDDDDDSGYVDDNDDGDSLDDDDGDALDEDSPYEVGDTTQDASGVISRWDGTKWVPFSHTAVQQAGTDYENWLGDSDPKNADPYEREYVDTLLGGAGAGVSEDLGGLGLNLSPGSYEGETKTVTINGQPATLYWTGSQWVDATGYAGQWSGPRQPGHQIGSDV